MAPSEIWIKGILLVLSILISFTYLSKTWGEQRAEESVQAFSHSSKNIRERSNDFGIGFDLTASYGTVAVSYANGTTLSIAKVDGSEKYCETWQRLSLDSSRHIAPPYDNMGDLWDDEPRQQLRKLRKRIGLPASADVGNIADLLAALRDKANDFVQEKFTTAVATIPHLVAVYNEDITDALEHVGLNMHGIWYYEHLVYETISAYAGLGLGLCRNYTNAADCLDTQREWERDIIMPVLYTRSALTMSFAPVRGAYFLWEPSYRHRVDFDLGSDKLASLQTPEEVKRYWSQVRTKLVEVMVERPAYDKPHKIILMGESASDPEFVRNLWLALATVMDRAPVLLDADPLFAAAKGAAEFAKRAPYTDQWWEISWNKSHNLTIPTWRHNQKKMAVGLHA